MADSDATTFTYRAFISYSHKDQRWARWLIRKLEAYRVPRDLAGAGQERRLGTFFRDRDEAAAADDLATTIRKALETSQHLIVVASPASAKSAYVEREIREFAELNRRRGQRGRILTLIADGEPNADDPTQECLPAALRGALAGDDGAPIEPLAADARPTGDGKTRALAKLVAGLLGVRYDALVRRDLQRRRRFQAAVVGAACAVAVVAAGVGWKFETDRREREELAQARARAESDRRTVAAVSTAERAKARLTAGDIDNAVRLARASLPDDGSLPFIPQAYSTLYAAYMNGGAPVDLDIQGGTYAFKTFTTPLSDGQYLSWNDGGNVRIWSPSRGVSYATEFDPQSREPSVTPDEDAVFVPSLNGEMRYRVAARAWDEIDTNGLSDRIANVNAVLALSADTLLACLNDELMQLTLPPAGSGAPIVDWRQSMGTLGCDHLAVSDAAIFATANGGKVLQLDRKTREPIRTYESGTSLIDGLAVHGNRLAVQLIGKTLIFTIGTDDPPVTLETHGFSSVVSPDGRFAIESDIGGGKITIHDLANDGKTTLDCDICRVMGFTADTAIMMEDNKVVSRHVPDGEQIALLHQFADKVDEGLFFPERNTVIGIRQFGPSTVVRLDNQPKGILVAPSGGRKMFMSFAGFVNDEAVALVEAELGGEGIFRRTFGRIVHTNGQEAKPVWEAEITGTGPTGYGTIQPLGHDLVLVRKGESMMSAPFKAEIIDPFAGTTIFAGRLLNETETIADGRMLVEEETGFSLVDLAKRTVTPVANSDKRPDWSVAGNRLLMTDREGIEIRDLVSDAGGQPAAKLKMNGAAETICVAADNDTIYATTSDGKLGYLERWSIGKGERTGLAVLSPADDEDVLSEIIALINVGRAVRQGSIRCSAGAITFDGTDMRVTWAAGTQKPTIGAKIDDTTLPPEAEPDAPPPDASRIESAELVLFDNVAALRDPSTGEWLFRTPEQESRIVSARLLRKHHWLAVALENGRLRAWDATAPAAPLLDLIGHESRINSLDVDSTENEILSADPSGRVRLWPTYGVSSILARTADLAPAQ